MPHPDDAPKLIIPAAGAILGAIADKALNPIPKRAGLVTVDFQDGGIIIRADGSPVLNVSISMGLELLARLASAIKDAIKGRP
jgi:hypothetical protein